MAVSRALGDHFVKISNMGLSGEPFVSQPIKLEPSDEMVILASDGVRKPLSPPHIMCVYVYARIDS